MHQEKNTKTRNEEKVPDGALPAYLLDREGQSRAKVLSNMIKQKRKEKAVSYFQESLMLVILVVFHIAKIDPAWLFLTFFSYTSRSAIFFTKSCGL